MAGTQAVPAQSSRRRTHPAQRMLLFAAAGVTVGSFLPWVDTSAGLTYSGFAGAGVWTFYAGVFGIAGGLVPLRWLAAAQGAVMALVAVAIPVWQVAHLINLVGFNGWLPGPGLVVVFASGLLAALSAFRILRD